MSMIDTFKALADPCRMRLTAVLLAGEFTVQELTRIMGMGQSRVSRHLKILTEAGLLSVKHQGTWSYYRAGDGSRFFSAIRPSFERELESLPERGRDLAAVRAVLEERRRRSQEFFDLHAGQWDELARTLLPVPEYRRQLLELVPEGGSVLEIGIGTGGLLAELAARASQVIGVDHSPAMLEEARRRLACNGTKGIELRLGEMNHLPLPDASVECVVANMVLHHAADPTAVLAEIRRVLAPGGTLLVADLARHEREAAREQLADQWLGFDEAELTEWLIAAGFGEVCCERIEGASGEETVLLSWGVKLPPPTPLLNEEGEIKAAPSLPPSPPPGSGGAGGGRSYGDVPIHNKPEMKSLRQCLRNEATPAERELWNLLRKSSLGGHKFRRQHGVGRYIVDFYCPSERLAIELDGDSHFTKEASEYDRERTIHLNSLNIRVIRFLNSDVHENPDAVCGMILEELKRTTPGPS